MIAACASHVGRPVHAVQAYRSQMYVFLVVVIGTYEQAVIRSEPLRPH